MTVRYGGWKAFQEDKEFILVPPKNILNLWGLLWVRDEYLETTFVQDKPQRSGCDGITHFEHMESFELNIFTLVTQ